MSGKLNIDKFGGRKVDFSTLVNNDLVSCELQVEYSCILILLCIQLILFSIRSFFTLCFMVKVCQVGLGGRTTWSCMADNYIENATSAGGIQITI